MTLSLINRFNTAQEEPLNGIAPEQVYITEKLAEQYSLNAQVMLASAVGLAGRLLEQENYIRVSSTGQTYRIKDISKTNRRKTPVLDLSAEHIFFDIIGVKQDKSTAINGNATFNAAMTYALTGTGWTFKVVTGTFYSVTYENFAGNALDLFKRLQTRHGFEWYPDSRNLTVYIYEKLGTVTQAQIRYNHNLISITEKTSTTNLVNCRKGYGKKKEFTEENPEPAVLKDSDYVCVAVWKDAASISKYGERWGDDYENENYTIVENLTQALADMSDPEPVVSLSLNFAQLGEYGESVDNDTADLGNTIFIIHEPLSLDVNARIVARKIYPETTRKSPELTISNVVTTSVSQQVKLRQDIAQLTRETTTQLSRIGSIAQTQIDTSTSVEGLAGNVQTLANNLSALAVIVNGQNSTIDTANQNSADAKNQISNAVKKADAADAKATAADSKATTNASAISRLNSRTTQTVSFNSALSGTLSAISTASEYFIAGTLKGALATSESVLTLPQGMALPSKAGTFVFTNADGTSAGVEYYQIKENKLYLLTSNRQATDSLIVDFSYRY